jgi:hypothetical protein
LSRLKRLSATALVRGQIVLFKELLPLAADELGALVGMHMDLGFGFAQPGVHEQGLPRQISIGAALH